MPDVDPIMASLALLALPLFAFLAQVAGGWLLRGADRAPSRLGGWVPTITMLVAWVGATALFATRVLGAGGPLAAQVFSRPWISVGPTAAITVPFGVLVDGLTLTMLFIVTTVSALVHLYATAYMRDQAPGARRYERFFAH